MCSWNWEMKFKLNYLSHNSTSINAFELFFHCTVIYQDISWSTYLFKDIQYTESYKHVLMYQYQEAKTSVLQWHNWSPPIRNSILQHQESTEVTTKILYQLMLTSEPCQFHENCLQLLHIYNRDGTFCLIKLFYLKQIYF